MSYLCAFPHVVKFVFQGKALNFTHVVGRKRFDIKYRDDQIKVQSSTPVSTCVLSS